MASTKTNPTAPEKSARCPRHDTAHGTPFTREQQFALDWSDYTRWAIGPLATQESFRAEWEQRHTACV